MHMKIINGLLYINFFHIIYLESSVSYTYSTSQKFILKNLKSFSITVDRTILYKFQVCSIAIGHLYN